MARLCSEEGLGLGAGRGEVAGDVLCRCLLGLFPCFLRGLPLVTCSARVPTSTRLGVPTVASAQDVGSTSSQASAGLGVFASGAGVGGAEKVSAGADGVGGVCGCRCRNRCGRHLLRPCGLFRGEGVVGAATAVVSLPDTECTVTSPTESSGAAACTRGRLPSGPLGRGGRLSAASPPGGIGEFLPVPFLLRGLPWVLDPVFASGGLPVPSGR